ncbi:MAG: DUF29 domain-containing protein, partial [Chromatiaceae bacterium]|nr:DUF29 domain-containing protein [Candidatus Thioaporhodococcus sediminis]
VLLVSLMEPRKQVLAPSARRRPFVGESPRPRLGWPRSGGCPRSSPRTLGADAVTFAIAETGMDAFPESCPWAVADILGQDRLAP